ncbi:tetratricopeptide repeat protein [Streptomyces sp. HNM0575]|nr:tetratricopeptide repeat protein [Streptomyces sp. HNM0575]
MGLLLWGRHLDGGSNSLDLTPVTPVATSSLRSLRPPQAGSLARGREDELRCLMARLRRPQGRFAVVCAAGGVGKTTLATALAEQAQAEKYAVFWVHWREPGELAEQLTEVALACGLPPEELKAAQAGHANLIDAVWNQLARTRRWLLVIDNVDSPDCLAPEGEKIAQYRGWARPHGGGLLLLTSRDMKAETWGPCADLHRLTPLDSTSGGQVLTDAAPQAGTHADAEALADRLGGLPLALQAAGRYIAEPTSRYRTFTAYRHALAEELSTLLGAHVPGADDPEVARGVVRQTWEVSLEQLADEGNILARPLLRLLALLGAAPIPRSLITPGLLETVTGQPVSPVALDAAFYGLDRYGLLGTTDLDAGDISESQVVLHSLIREINALALAADDTDPQKWREALAERLVDAVGEVQRAGRAGWPTAHLLAPHLPTLLEDDSPLHSREAVRVLEELAGVLVDARDDAPHRMLRQTVLDVETRELGSDHPDTLSSRNNLANALSSQGEYSQAADLHRETLETRMRVLGPDHPDTLKSRGNLASALDLLGEYAQAADFNRVTLETRMRVLGPDHPDTLKSRGNLANTLYSLGEYAQAADLHRETLEAFTRVLGSDHPDTLSSRNNLANALRSLGEYAQAADLHRETLEAFTRVLGSDHPVTLSSRNNLANTLYSQGEYAQAADLHRETLKTRIRLLGPDHPDTLRSRSNLATARTAIRNRRLRSLWWRRDSQS